jgi:tetrapyrrole methylase family protein/MazG family protein
MDKLEEELSELREAVKDRSNPVEELGDLLFAAVNVARFLSADPEETLHKACDKFIHRFHLVEELAAQQGDTLERMSLAEMDGLWDQAKAQDK